MKKKKSLFHKLKIHLRATRRLLNIRSSSDPEGTIKDISNNLVIKGYNIWILVCSGLLASIGLDTNSTAVIIGAMLISPLMSPILGVGLGLGINDKEMFVSALRNLATATFASLCASFIYFTITPLGEPTSEIMARTEPTLLDVLVALFGGIAGIVSGSRREKTNAIPGVAIATALMPPLCASGYGLAKWDLPIFLGAFYLFFINAVFISLSTFMIVKYLEFPLHQEPDEKTQRTVARVMTSFLIIVILPSIYFFYNILHRVNTLSSIDAKVEEVIQRITKDGQHEVLNIEKPKTPEEVDKVRSIKLYVSGNPIPKDSIAIYNAEFQKIGDYRFSISILNNVSSEEIKQLSYSITQENVLQLKTKFERLETKFDTLSVTQQKIEKTKREAKFHKTLLEELQVFFPELMEVQIIDPRTEEEKAQQQVASDSLRLDSLRALRKISFELEKCNYFPYIKIHKKVQSMEQVHYEILTDSLSKEFKKYIYLTSQKSFPYIHFRRRTEADTLFKRKYKKFFELKNRRNFPYLAVAKSTNILADTLDQSEMNLDLDFDPDFFEPVELITIEIILTWYEEIKQKRLNKESRQKIIDFLTLKLKPNPARDSIVLKSLIRETPFE